MLASLLIVGMYCPTDASGRITALSVAADLVCLLLLAQLIWRRNYEFISPVSIILLSITPLLLVFSGTSGLPTLKLGALAGYGLLSLLCLVDVRDIPVSRWLDRLWQIINVVNIGGGIAILAGFQPVDDLIIKYYSFGYDELVPNMLMWHRPVLTFASHSIAGFFWYLFFWINLQAYKARREKIFIIFSIFYILFSYSMLSVTGLLLGFISTVQLGIFAWSRIRHKLAVSGVLISLFLISMNFWSSKLTWPDAVDIGKRILQDPHNGFLGRFLPDGTMYDDVQYIKDHPLSPVGVSYKAGMMFGDSGPVEYVLRGSLPLLLLVYGGFYYFLRRNLVSRRHVHFLFAATLAFELGISSLTYFRTFCLLPVFVVYLNHLQRLPSGTVKGEDLWAAGSQRAGRN